MRGIASARNGVIPVGLLVLWTDVREMDCCARAGFRHSGTARTRLRTTAGVLTMWTPHPRRSNAVPFTRMCPSGRRAGAESAFPGRLVVAAPRRLRENGHQSLRHCLYQGVRRGCHIHVVSTTWLGHPRLIIGGRGKYHQSRQLAGAQKKQGQQAGYAPCATLYGSMRLDGIAS